MSGLYRYVAIAEIPLWEAQGWRFISLLGGAHGLYSVLMQLEGWE